MKITEKQIQEELERYMNKNFTVKDLDYDKAKNAYLEAVRMVLEKANLTPICDRDCPDCEYGNCFHPNDCCKIYSI